jgi:hypothetical protein
MMKKIQNTFLAGVCALAAVLYANIQAQAQDATAAVAGAPKTLAANAKASATSQPGAKSGRPYFIEFRSRSALSYGHTFAVVGRVGSKITAANVVGLHPFTESSVPWVLGHVVPVPSENGFSDGDIEDEYITARYRIYLTTAEHQKLTAYLSKLKAKSPMWHAALYNCNAYVADIAESLGLKAPFNKWQFPKEFITELKEMNNSIKQLPPSVKTASANPQ